MNLRKYIVYLDDGYDAMRLFIPAENEESARHYVRGNGEVVAIRDVTEEYPISLDKVCKALESASFGKAEIDLIMRTLLGTGIAE